MNFQPGCKNSILENTGIDFSQLRIGYASYSDDFLHPGDCRRFCYYAKERNIKYEIANSKETYDLVIVTENADISIWSQYYRGNPKIIYDLIDPYLAIPYTNIKGMFRGMAKYVVGQSKYLRINHWNTITDMCCRSDAVICTTIEQKADILKFNNNIHIILDSHDEVIKSIKSNYACGDIFNIVWEGLPQNVEQLYTLRNALKVLSKHYNIALHIITDTFYNKYMGIYFKKDTLREARIYYKNTYLHEWNMHTLSSIIIACDLGVIPINLKDPFAKGKSVNKLLLFWGMAMPVIVSTTPAYKRSMEETGIPMFCNGINEWVEMLEIYINDASKRKHAGQVGRDYVENECNYDIILRRWDKLMSSVLL